MTWLKRGFAVAAAVLGLTACGSYHVFYGTWSQDACLADTAEWLEGREWSEVAIIDIRIRQGEYSPMVTHLSQERPYILRLTNRDDVARAFRAREFFQSVAMSKVTVGGDEKPDPCIAAIWMGPHETAEIELVAVRDGRYPFEDSSYVFDSLLSGGATGVIIID